MIIMQIKEIIIIKHKAKYKNTMIVNTIRDRKITNKIKAHNNA